MTEFTFPQGFLWGSATSAYQVEGHNTNNDWWAWEQAGHVKESSGAACEQYERFREDFALAKSLHHNTHRFSIEWSRIEPAEGVWDDAAIAHYRDVVLELRRLGIEPVVTLHHFTNPLWLAAKGGWTNPIVVDRFARYTRKMAEALGDQVRWWLTINEPMVYAVMHYLEGTGPPGARDLRLMSRVREHLIRAHAASYRVIHEVSRPRGWAAQVSLANHVAPFLPCRRWWPPDRLVARLTELAYNHRFIETLVSGELRVPGERPLVIPEAKQTLDYIGLNYYSRLWMRARLLGAGGWFGSRCYALHHKDVTERSGLQWDIYPPGIAQILGWAKPWGVSVLVTENGICPVDDPQRERFILNHLAWVARAMQEGVPVIGYLYWSLLDNYEWAEGYGPRFGLIEVDYKTQARRIRPSARRFAEICRTNTLPLDP
ncbi:MAG: glycoside hydrolase family 1 protein [Candidatus Omnitrophica bacterium]|nr:glycoside hydrolase family 1 protein [Candidatus Omnitrophota bacterium]